MLKIAPMKFDKELFKGTGEMQGLFSEQVRVLVFPVFFLRKPA